MPEPAEHAPTLPHAASTQPPTRASDTHTQSSPAGSLPTIPGFEILGLLGRGGMGAVYRARQLSLNREVAVKMILAGPAGEMELSRFSREAEGIARLRHPNIVQIYEVGQANGQPYLVLELVEGGSLKDRLGDTPQPAAEAAKMIATLARAVHAAHLAGVVHRDLKPANILLTNDNFGTRKADSGPTARATGSTVQGPRDPAARDPQSAFQPKVSDFGLAKFLGDESGQTRTGDILGTPGYMAPEQASGRGKEIGPGTDVWALGVILYEALTGSRPFRARDMDVLLAMIRTEDPVPPGRVTPGIPHDLETICLKCLRKEPAKRYATAEALADDLERFLAGRPILARPVGAIERARLWVRRNPAVSALLSLLALAVGGGFGAILWQLGEVRDREQKAVANAARADRNAGHALRAADVLAAELTEAIRPLAGTQSPAVEKLLDRAATVYDELLAEGENPAALAGKGRLLTSLADLYLELDRTRRAADAADQAVAIFERPGMDEPAHVRGLADALEKKGRAVLQRGRLDDAQATLDRSLELRKRLSAEAPGDPDRTHELAYAHLWAGWVRFMRNDIDGAAREFEQADARVRPLAERHPDRVRWQWTAAIAREKIGDGLFYRPGRLAVARTEYDAAAAIFRHLAAAEPANLEWQVNLCRVNCSAAEAYMGEKNWAKARELLDAELLRARRIHESDPDNGRRHAPLIRCQMLLLNLRLASEPGAPVGGELLRLQEENVAVLAKLAARDPDAARWAKQEPMSRVTLAGVYLEAGVKRPKAADEAKEHFAAAWGHIRIALPRLTALSAAEPADAELRKTLLDAYYLAAELAGLDPALPERDTILADGLGYYRQRAAAGELPPDYKETLTHLEKLAVRTGK